MNIKDRAVLITGANRGIGRAMIEEALKRGVRKVYAATRVAFEHADPRVIPVLLDVTSAADIQRSLANIESLDVLINNAGVATYDDLGDPAVIEHHLAVNLFGLLNVTRALLPLLERSKGAIVNNLSLAGIAPLPMIPSYSLSKAAAASVTQSLRMLLASEGVTVHAAFIGPTDTDMTRGLEIPKSSPAVTAQGIFEGLANNEDDIFPDPASQPTAEGWRQGVAKGMERQFAAFAPTAAVAATSATLQPNEDSRS